MKISGDDINYSNFVVPTLIPQIEGIQNEFMKMNGLSINRHGIFDSDGNKIIKKDYFRQLTSGNEFYDVMNDIFWKFYFKMLILEKNVLPSILAGIKYFMEKSLIMVKKFLQ